MQSLVIIYVTDAVQQYPDRSSRLSIKTAFKHDSGAVYLAAAENPGNRHIRERSPSVFKAPCEGKLTIKQECGLCMLISSQVFKDFVTNIGKFQKNAATCKT